MQQAALQPVDLPAVRRLDGLPDGILSMDVARALSPDKFGGVSSASLGAAIAAIPGEHVSDDDIGALLLAVRRQVSTVRGNTVLAIPAFSSLMGDDASLSPEEREVLLSQVITALGVSAATIGSKASSVEQLAELLGRLAAFAMYEHVAESADASDALLAQLQYFPLLTAVASPTGVSTVAQLRAALRSLGPIPDWMSKCWDADASNVKVVFISVAAMVLEDVLQHDAQGKTAEAGWPGSSVPSRPVSAGAYVEAFGKLRKILARATNDRRWAVRRPKVTAAVV